MLKKALVLKFVILTAIMLFSCGGSQDSHKFYKDNYSYDSQDRLERERYESSTETVNIRYIYDNNGNILEVQIN